MRPALCLNMGSFPWQGYRDRLIFPRAPTMPGRGSACPEEAQSPAIAETTGTRPAPGWPRVVPGEPEHVPFRAGGQTTAGKGRGRPGSYFVITPQAMRGPAAPAGSVR